MEQIIESLYKQQQRQYQQQQQLTSSRRNKENYSYYDYCHQMKDAIECAPKIVYYNFDESPPSQRLQQQQKHDNEDDDNESVVLTKIEKELKNRLSGTIRGNLNYVKKTLSQINNKNDKTQNYQQQHHNYNPIRNIYSNRDFEIEERNKIVIYTTSLHVIRKTFDNCIKAKKILNNLCLKYEERDLYKYIDFKAELNYRLSLLSSSANNKTTTTKLPHIFLSGIYIGTIEYLELLNDEGYLNELFKDIERINGQRKMCQNCGDSQYILCTYCNGSKKTSIVYNQFKTLKCTACNQDGLLKCNLCFDGKDHPQHDSNDYHLV